jgi:hypothetical protein
MSESTIIITSVAVETLPLPTFQGGSIWGRVPRVKTLG